MYPQNQSSGSGNLQPPGGGCSTTAAPGDDNCSFYRFLETMQQIHEEYSAKFNYEQSLRQFENSLNELNNVQRQLEYIEKNIKIQNQISESLKAQGIDYRPSNMDQLFKSSYEGQYHKLVDKVNANLNKTVQNYQQYNNVVKANRISGKAAENYLNRIYGGDQQVFRRTSIGRRYIDNLVDGRAMESKVGCTSLRSSIRNQVLKDYELMNTKFSGVNRVEWHFFPGKTGIGPTGPLSNFLIEHGIIIILH